MLERRAELDRSPRPGAAGPRRAARARRDRPVRDRCRRGAARRSLSTTRAARPDRHPYARGAPHHADVRARGERPSRRGDRARRPPPTRRRRRRLRPTRSMWLAQQRGRCALLTGQVETACRWLGEAAARCETRQRCRDRGGSCSRSSPPRRHARATRRRRARGSREAWTSSRRSALRCPNRSSAGVGTRRRRRSAGRSGRTPGRSRHRSIDRVPHRRRRGCCTTSPVSATPPASSIASASSRALRGRPRRPRTRPTPKRSPRRSPGGLTAVADRFEAIGALLLAAEACRGGRAGATSEQAIAGPSAAMSVRASTFGGLLRGSAHAGARRPGDGHATHGP